MTFQILRALISVRFLRGFFSVQNWRQLRRAWVMKGIGLSLGTADSDVAQIVKSGGRYTTLIMQVWLAMLQQDLDITGHDLIRTYDYSARAKSPSDVMPYAFPAEWGPVQKEAWIIRELEAALQVVHVEADTSWLQCRRDVLGMV